MKLQILLSALLALALTAVAPAQLATKDGKRSDEIQLKMHKIEVLVQILPLAMKKEQILAFLPALEKVRAEQKKTLALEDDTLAKLEAELNTTLADAMSKGALPTREIQAKIISVRRALGTQRMALGATFVEDLTSELQKILDKGQYAVLSRSLDAKLLNPTKPEEVKEIDRAKAFVRVYFLDPVTYDLLVELSKTP